MAGARASAGPWKSSEQSWSNPRDAQNDLWCVCVRGRGVWEIEDKIGTPLKLCFLKVGVRYCAAGFEKNAAIGKCFFINLPLIINK